LVVGGASAAAFSARCSAIFFSKRANLQQYATRFGSLTRGAADKQKADAAQKAADASAKGFENAVDKANQDYLNQVGTGTPK
jgi:hypothetical protein